MGEYGDRQAYSIMRGYNASRLSFIEFIIAVDILSSPISTAICQMMPNNIDD